MLKPHVCIYSKNKDLMSFNVICRSFSAWLTSVFRAERNVVNAMINLQLVLVSTSYLAHF